MGKGLGASAKSQSSRGWWETRKAVGHGTNGRGLFLDGDGQEDQG